MKNKIKIFLTFPVLFLLTGCDYIHYKTGILEGNWIGQIQEACEKIGLGVLEWLNACNAAIVRLSFSLTTGESSINDIARETLQNFGSVTKIVNLISILAIMLIIINFAKSVFKNNFSTVDRVTAPSAIQLFKKVFISAIVTIAIPYLCIGGFVVSTFAGENATQMIIGTQEISDSEWNIFNEMNQDHVGFATYCEGGQKLANPDNYYFADLVEETSQGTRSGIIKEDSSLYNKYCNYSSMCSADKGCEVVSTDAGEAPKNIYQGLKYSAKYHSVITVGAAQTDSTIFGNTVNGALTPVFTILYVLVIGIVWVVSIVSTLRRVIDLVVLIGMSWWYIGSSIADQEGQTAINDLIKKLLKICMSQFLLTFEITLFTTLTLSKGFSILNLLMSISWCAVLLSTPTVVEEMMGSTGTVESAKGKAKGIFNFLTGGK